LPAELIGRRLCIKSCLREERSNSQLKQKPLARAIGTPTAMQPGGTADLGELGQS
jgi:hypothetical protein